MRFDTKISFYSKGADKYNPKTGKHDAEIQLVASLWGNVTDNSTQRNVETFGKYDINTKIIRLIENINFDWSYLVIGDSKQQYTMLHELRTLKTNSILVGESNGNEA